MKVKNVRPEPKLSDYVERVLIIENERVLSPFSLSLFANGMPTLLFTSKKGHINNVTTGNLTLFGQTVAPGTLILEEKFVLIAYFFKPISLTTLFNVPGLELTDKPVDLSLIMPKQTDELADRLLHLSDTAAEMLPLLDRYIESLIAKAKAHSPIIQFAANIIASNTSKETIPFIQKDLRISTRTFQRIFEKHIGINPNMYRRICQFNNAFQQLNNRKFDKLSDIAFENGYSDQSHYIRTFKEFTNITPKDYFSADS
jgi:AraC-like DNA-binding protein